MTRNFPRFSGLALSNLSIPSKLALIVAVFCVIIVTLLGIGNFSISILSDVRAYVGGEGLWSKAQKDAVNSLIRYTVFQNEEDYQRYLDYLEVPLGDRQARFELEKKHSNLKKIERAFVKGRNHPDDVAGMATLFKHFSFVPYIGNAVRIWQEADTALNDLIAAGEDIRREVSAGTMTNEKVRAYLVRINGINDRLTPLEDEFSYELGEGARWLKKVAFWAMAGSAALLLLIGILIAALIARHLISEIHLLRDAAANIAKGNFDYPVKVKSSDEVGDLARNFRDMAMQRKQAEQLLAQRAQELDEANKKLIETERMKDNFFATVSHELRTPLTLVLAPLESILASDYGQLNESQRQILETMHNNTVRLLQMVTGLLDFSKLEAGRIEIHREPLDVAEITGIIINDFRPAMRQRGIQEEIHLEPVQGLNVMMDRYLYERILFNLLSNAVKFTPPDGKISVSVRWEQDRLQVTVSDTGIGIAKENLKYLFEKFKQLEGASTRRFEGTGLGLALVKEFALLLDGDVSVESKPGKGSMFTVHCAAVRAEKPSAKAVTPSGKRTRLVQQFRYSRHKEAPSAEEGDRVKLLIAEDNDELTSYIVEQLKPLAQIRTASDGEHALEIIKAWRPDLVLSDVMMPKMDGLTLCRAIKKNPQTAGIPVILLTALTHREALLRGWEAGADEYLFKPFHPKELYIRIKSFISNIQLLNRLNRELVTKARELARSQAELEQLELYAFVTSHDLQEPLRKILIFGEMLQSSAGADLNEEGLSYLKRLEDAAARMSHYINELAEFSRVTSRGGSFEKVGLNEIMEEVLEIFELTLKESGAEVRVEELPEVKADRVQMRQLFQNLIGNAIKFKKDKEDLRITVKPLSQDDETVQIAVEDNGIGFEEKYQDKIFKPFQRLHRREDIQGSGMGLAICEKIILRHGGKISAKSIPGKGSTFIVQLPIRHLSTTPA